MNHSLNLVTLALALAAITLPGSFAAAALPVVQLQHPEIRIVPSHPWLPPFGLDRVGRPLVVEVKLPATPAANTAYCLAGYVNGKEVQRHNLPATAKSTAGQKVNVEFNVWPKEVVLLAKSTADEKEHRVTTQSVDVPALDADAEAKPVHEIHPVDLGTILVPQNWLLLTGGQAANVEVAALSRGDDMAGATASAWYESAPQTRATAALPLSRDRRQMVKLALAGSSTTLERDTLHATIADGAGRELWRKDLPVMLVQQPPRWPRFGATAAKLRYDAPISVRESDGSFSKLDYARAWDMRLNDVVVSLPNGSRFVFWRGSCYIPFWAGRNNTGMCYEWAETRQKDGVDCVEPLMDKELRYGSVEIIESTAARVHVRWRYESCDFNYKVWGDTAVEDFYFYPDGFGSRVLTLQRAPEQGYELSEFIILTPQGAVPFSVLPPNLVDILFLDGEKRGLIFPYAAAEQGAKLQSRNLPAVYRVRLHKDEPTAAVYFCPNDLQLPQHIFKPFEDSGRVVTPCYWGSHWPLARGQTTVARINDRIYSTPAANSVMSWAQQRPEPLRDASLQTLDSLGRSRPMRVQTWAWLISMTDAPDARLIDWARSFSAPPSVSDLKGARLAAEPYIPERRAIGLQAEAARIELTLTPGKVCVNPVLEITAWDGKSVDVWLGGRRLAPKDYAWDGRVLWIDSTFSEATHVRIEIAN